MEPFHLYLISDSTGETVNTAARASLVQFDDVDTETHLWPMIHSREGVERVIKAIRKKSSFVLYTLVNADIRAILEDEC